MNKGRFKSQALLDEQALAACLAYVDLNPIRADMAKTPETSDHTSIQRRIQSIKSNGGEQQSLAEALFPFVGNPRDTMPQGLPFRLDDYLELAGRSYASCIRGISGPPPGESLPVTGPDALSGTLNEVQFLGTCRRSWSAWTSIRSNGFSWSPNLKAGLKHWLAAPTSSRKQPGNWDINALPASLRVKQLLAKNH